VPRTPQAYEECQSSRLESATRDAMTVDEVLDIERDDSRWAPPPGVTRHSGDPIQPTADFFADPPTEIGEVISAETSLSSYSRPWKLMSRVALAGLIGWGGAMILEFALKRFNPVEQSVLVTWEILLFLIVAALSWYFTRFSRRCSFVGKLGLARRKCKGNRNRVVGRESFLFENAAELRTAETRMYNHGMYLGTSYAFTWTDATGKKRNKLSGTYRGENKPPAAKDPYHFAVMAEGAWTAYLFDKLVTEAEASPSARFNLGGKHFVAIGPGFLDVFVSGSEPIRLTADEVGGIQVDAGVIKIKSVDAKEGWFSSTGVYKFNYQKMANSRLFLLLYARWIGK
jgi:hypothetical protein